MGRFRLSASRRIAVVPERKRVTNPFLDRSGESGPGRRTFCITDDRALIEPLVLTAKRLVGQLRPFSETINEFDRKIRELFKSHPDHFLFETLPGAGEKLALRLLSCLVPTDLAWAGATDPRRSAKHAIFSQG
jgi:hypothetical protein